MEKCRACLETDCSLHPIDEDFVYKYNILTNINVNGCDNMFQYVCETCLQSVNFFINFREKCILSETSIRNMCKNVKPVIEQNDGNIKVEFSDYDTFLDSTELTEDINFIIKEEDVAGMADVADIENVADTKIKIKQYKKKKKYTKVELCDQPFSCGLCSKEYVNKIKLSEHLEGHKGTKNCTKCYESFRDWPQLLSHRLAHLPSSQKTCHLCPRRFQTPESIEFHYRKNHFDEKNIQLHCNKCGNTFTTPRKLRQHIWSMHSNKIFVCDHCSKVFSNKHHLILHIVSHMDVKKYFCNLCKFSCKYSRGLLDHRLRKHTPKKVYCNNCKRPFQNQQACDKHKCKQKPIQVCTVCGLQLNANMRLARHMETHKEVGSHKCNRCPKAYKTRGALVAHMNKHDGNRTNHCEFCPAKFYHQSALIKHRRTHTGEKPYVCKICNRGFTGNHNLKLHMKVHGQHNLIVKKFKPELT